MSQLEHHVSIVRSRFAISRALSALAWAIVAVAALAVVAILVDRLLLYRPGMPRYRFLFGRPGVALGIALGAGAIASVAWGIRRRPSPRDAAAAIDETLGTHEAFSTALYLKDRPELAGDPFTQAMLRQALVAADKTSVAGRFPIRVPRTFWIAAAVAAVAFGLSFLGGYDLFRTAEKAELARVKVEQEAVARKELTDALAQINAAPAAVQANVDVQAAKQQINEMLQPAAMRDPGVASRTAAKAQQTLDETKDTQKRLANVQNFAKVQANRDKLNKLPDSGDKSTLAEATRAIKQGNFDGAIDKIGELAKEFERMDPGDQKKAAEEMAALSQQLKDAVDKNDDLKKLAEQMQKNGVTEQQAKDLQSLMAKAAQGDPQAAQQAQQMAQQMMQQAGATPQQQQAVQQLAQQMQGAQNSQAMMQQLQQAAQQMASTMQQQANPGGQQQTAPGQQSPTMQPSPQQTASTGQQPAGQSPITPPGVQTPSVGPTIQSPISPLQQTSQSGGQQQASAGQQAGSQGGQQASGQQPGGPQQGGQQPGGQQPGGQQANGQQPGGQQPGGQQQGGQQPGGQQGSQQAGAQPGGNQPNGQQPGNQGGQQPGQSVAQSAKEMQDQLEAIKKDMQQMQAAQKSGQQQGQQPGSQQANNSGSQGGQQNNGGQQAGQQGGSGQPGGAQQAAAGNAGGGNAPGGQGQGGRNGGGGGNQGNGGGGQPGQAQGNPQQLGDPNRQGGAGGMGGAGIAQGGDRAVEEAPFDFKPEVSKSQNNDAGKTLARSFIKDDQPDKGEMKAQLQEAVRSNLQQSSDEVDSQRIGRQAQKSVRDYFKTIAGLNDATAAPTGGQANEPAPK